ncbi:HupE/UreJ family protein [Pendulispora albinea]|uniref:HupE/UreJ family protein n=1 Tax=Pendulispora albinea TaxID=2741071 RepID=A0ABZ2M130_9BACT
MMRRAFVVLIAFAFHLLRAAPAQAHKPSDAYLTLNAPADRSSAASTSTSTSTSASTSAPALELDGRWDIALRDLTYAMHLDANDDGNLTWGELRTHRAQLEAYAFAHLTVAAGDRPCQTIPGELRIVPHSDGNYAVLLFRLACDRAPGAASSGSTAAADIHVNYSIFFDIDPQHHGLLRFRNPEGERAAIFTAAAPSQRFAWTAPPPAQSFRDAVAEGVGHIASGIDHLLFLLALLLPSVLRREGRTWRPVSDFRAAFRDVLGIVTAFTVAHSITLSLAALDVVRLPSRVVESGIAASVVLAALNNLVPVLRGERWAAAFALGLLHGFGFSAVLVDLGLARAELVRVLLGFNLGVELGQCAVVAAFLPLAYAARAKPLYHRMALLGGSAAIAAIAVVWLVERAFIAT